MNAGQITLDSDFGKYLYNLCKDTNDIPVVVEDAISMRTL
jgi:hypothetical protein